LKVWQLENYIFAILKSSPFGKNLPPKKILIWINLRAVLGAFSWGLGFSVSPKCEKKKKNRKFYPNIPNFSRKNS
jgi:hypothetical protein